MTIHCSRGVGASPVFQNILSNSIIGSPVSSPKHNARVDFPDAPRPMIRTRFTSSSVSAPPIWLPSNRRTFESRVFLVPHRAQPTGVARLNASFLIQLQGIDVADRHITKQ